MAVLKSPNQRNSKNKWIRRYSTNSLKSVRGLIDRRSPRVNHKLQLFLKKSLHWYSLKASRQHYLNKMVLRRSKIRPSHILRYSTNTFDLSLVNPLIARRHLRMKANRKRFGIWLNADCLN